MRRRTLPSSAPRALALALALPLVGCRPAASGGGDTTAAAAAAARPADPVSPPPADSLRLRLDVPREVPLGSAVPLTLRVENVAGRPLDLYLRGREITVDVTVARAGGEVVWRRLADEVIPAIVHLRTLAAGEVVEVRAEWDQRIAGGGRAAAGDYVVRGAVLTELAEPLETPAVPLRLTRP